MIAWDTSALIRCYSPRESDHARALNLLRNEQRQAGSAFLRIEAAGVIARRTGPDRRLRNSFLQTLEEHFARFEFVPVEGVQLDRALDLVRRHALGGADALHLAAALTLARETGRRTLRFATADEAQAAAARAEGLKVLALG